MSELVIGAGGGIGAACVLALAAGGGRVVCVDRDEIAARRTVEALTAAGARGVGVVADAADPAFSDTVCAQVGEEPVGTVLYAVAYEEHRPADVLGAASVRRSLEAGPLAAYELVRRLKARGRLVRGSCITFIGSLHAEHAFRGTLGYNLAQAATASLVQTLAHEWAPDGIRVNEVVPGWTQTEGEIALYGEQELTRRQGMLPFGRPGHPDDIAGAVRFLSSDAAAYISGARIVVDGALGASLAALPGGAS